VSDDVLLLANLWQMKSLESEGGVTPFMLATAAAQRDRKDYVEIMFYLKDLELEEQEKKFQATVAVQVQKKLQHMMLAFTANESAVTSAPATTTAATMFGNNNGSSSSGSGGNQQRTDTKSINSTAVAGNIVTRGPTTGPIVAIGPIGPGINPAVASAFSAKDPSSTQDRRPNKRRRTNDSKETKASETKASETKVAETKGAETKAAEIKASDKVTVATVAMDTTAAATSSAVEPPAKPIAAGRSRKPKAPAQRPAIVKEVAQKEAGQKESPDAAVAAVDLSKTDLSLKTNGQNENGSAKIVIDG
jgi:hypothetical protein